MYCIVFSLLCSEYHDYDTSPRLGLETSFDHDGDGAHAEARAVIFKTS